MLRVQHILSVIAIVAAASAPPPMLVPGSHELQSAKLTERCDSLWFLSRASGETTEHELPGSGYRREQHIVGSNLVQVAMSSSPSGSFIDSTVFTRDELTPISEAAHVGPQVIQYRYDGKRVDVTTTNGDSAPSVKHHAYPYPLFNFGELDLVLRVLPLRPGYQALLPLFSEGDEDAEVDTVQVQGKDRNGVWQIRFGDKVIVATYGITDDSRAIVSYSHRFRADGPRWKGGTVWRQVFHACGAVQAAN